MGVIEDVRKVMQDFLAPELRAIDERLKNIESGHTALKAELKEFRSEVRDSFMKTDELIQTRYRELVTTMSLDARLKRVEEKEAESSGLLTRLTKEFFSEKQHIDTLHSLEKHQKPDPESGSK